MKLIKDKWIKEVDKPYDKILRSVVNDLRISADALRLYIILLNSNNDPKKGKIYTPTTESLATQFNVSARTIKNWLKELKKYGYIRIDGVYPDFTVTIYKQSIGVMETKKNSTAMNKEMVKNISPTLVKNIAPIIKDNGCPTKVGKQPLPTKVTPQKVELDVGDCVPSAPSSPSVTPQTTHTPTVDKKNDDNLICHTSINNEVNNNTPINDLQFLINNNIQFKDRYQSNTAYNTANWYACDISKYTNDYIAYAVSERLKDTPIKDIPSNTYSLLYYMVKYSGKTPNSKLWQAFLKETNNNTKLIDLIK